MGDESARAMALRKAIITREFQSLVYRQDFLNALNFVRKQVRGGKELVEYAEQYAPQQLSAPDCSLMDLDNSVNYQVADENELFTSPLHTWALAVDQDTGASLAIFHVLRLTGGVTSESLNTPNRITGGSVLLQLSIDDEMGSCLRFRQLLFFASELIDFGFCSPKGRNALTAYASRRSIPVFASTILHAIIYRMSDSALLTQMVDNEDYPSEDILTLAIESSNADFVVELLFCNAFYRIIPLFYWKDFRGRRPVHRSEERIATLRQNAPDTQAHQNSKIIHALVVDAERLINNYERSAVQIIQATFPFPNPLINITASYFCLDYISNL